MYVRTMHISLLANLMKVEVLSEGTGVFRRLAHDRVVLEENVTPGEAPPDLLGDLFQVQIGVALHDLLADGLDPVGAVLLVPVKRKWRLP